MQILILTTAHFVDWTFQNSIQPVSLSVAPDSKDRSKDIVAGRAGLSGAHVCPGGGSGWELKWNYHLQLACLEIGILLRSLDFWVAEIALYPVHKKLL